MSVNISTLLEMFKIILSISLFFVWVVRYENMVKEFEGYRFPYWFRDFIGVLMLSFSAMIIQNSNDLIILGCLGIMNSIQDSVFRVKDFRFRANGGKPQ